MAIIKNIIFDYGGVIIDIDYSRTQRAFEELGIKNFDSEYSQASQSSLFDDFETGKISESTFREKLNQQLGKKFSDEAIDNAWNALLLGIRPDRIKLLTELYGDYHTYLLSNTNLIHIRFMTKYLVKTYGRPNIENLFDKVYYSFVMGIRKPHPEIFRRVINDNGVIPSETLFIDDSIQNVEAAKAMGFVSVQYSLSEDLQLFLEHHLNRKLNAGIPV